MFGIKKSIRLILRQIEWRRHNTQNKTYLERYPVSTERIAVGIGSYGPVRIITARKAPRLKIGAYVSIAEDVTFIISAGHRYDCFSTFPFLVMNGISEFEALEKGGIIVEDDAWLGFGATIMDGVRVGRGAVVAAKAVVTHDVAPYEIVAGVPARHIGFRFDGDIIEKLAEVDFSRIDASYVLRHRESLEKPLDQAVIKELLSDLPGINK